MLLRMPGLRRLLAPFRRTMTPGRSLQVTQAPYPYQDFPPLKQAHLPHAILYANRFDMLRGLALPHQTVVAEVGVALGDFSAFLIETLLPREFVAADIFNLHTEPKLWDMHPRQIFKDDSHRAFYERRLAASRCLVTIRQGPSHIKLAEFPDGYFDLIYVDADHSYDAVTRDIEAARSRLRPGGYLIFNDYIMYDHIGQGPYGVVPAVNELVANHDWPVVGLALHPQLFCDIALQRPVN